MEKFDYYFITYAVGNGILANGIIPQHKPHDIDNGLNIASAQEMLINLYDRSALLISWQKTTRLRYEEFGAYLDKMNASMAEKKESHLNIVKFPQPPESK